MDILLYTPEEFAAMLQEGNAFATMIAEEARVISDQQSGYPHQCYSQTMAAHALRAAETICAAIEAHYRAQGASAILAPDAE